MCALLPIEVTEKWRDEDIPPESLGVFAGAAAVLPPLWRATTLRNARGRAPVDIAKNVPIARVLRDAEAALATRRRLAGPLRSALSVGRMAPPGQTPDALPRRPGSADSYSSAGLVRVLLHVVELWGH